MSKDAPVRVPGRENPDRVPTTVLVAANDRLQELRSLLTATATPSRTEREAEAAAPPR
ncbi:hypothetical protein [Actinocatenispora rupis]|uniref:Uncharacterized protein n=1 Tax=Actinocatenispora rupis TaxID=519421 RepID=A0A8J3J058_9ACTN|nr:hypothetical protein [Actinocatenispora rupis]GID12090.1 hypothetical protein Aru02nite_29790 [Actinocatenispora rupis]